MTFAHMFATLESRGLIPKRAAAKKSSLTHLARALGYTTLTTAPVDDACRDPAQWKAKVDTYCQTPNAKGRVMKQKHHDGILADLRWLFRLAEAQGLLAAPLPVRLLKAASTRTAYARSQRGASPYQDTYRRKTPYRLPRPQWPADIEAGWQTYTEALDRDLRERSLLTYAYHLETYFGFLAHIRAETPTWEKLFRVDLLRHYVHWHGARLGREDSSAHGVLTVTVVATIAKVLDRAAGVDQPTHPQLATYSGRLKSPPALHDKLRYHWAPLADIEAVAQSLIAEGRVPYVKKDGLRHPGLYRARRFQLGLILKLFVRVPLRQRNIRELQYPHNLWQHTRTGEWTLRFQGKELKVDWRNDAVHVFEVPLSRLYPADGPTPDDLIPTLEEFIKDFRPLLPNGKPGESPYLFLTSNGTPYSTRSLHKEVVIAIERRLAGVKLHPHMIRDIAATELLKKTKDYDLVAALLGNTVQMVIKHYAHLDQAEEVALATGHIGQILRKGRAGSVAAPVSGTSQ